LSSMTLQRRPVRSSRGTALLGRCGRDGVLLSVSGPPPSEHEHSPAQGARKSPVVAPPTAVQGLTTGFDHRVPRHPYAPARRALRWSTAAAATCQACSQPPVRQTVRSRIAFGRQHVGKLPVLNVYAHQAHRAAAKLPSWCDPRRALDWGESNDYDSRLVAHGVVSSQSTIARCLASWPTRRSRPVPGPQ